MKEDEEDVLVLNISIATFSSSAKSAVRTCISDIRDSPCKHCAKLRKTSDRTLRFALFFFAAAGSRDMVHFCR